MSPDPAYRAALGLAIATPLMLVWMIGAVGIIGAAGDPADMMYGSVLAVVIVGAGIARLRPRGMALTLAAAAATQGLVGIIALASGSGGTNPRFEIVGLTGMYMAMFAISARLFERAATQRARTR